jgi:YidC/Oxa1 family membrane protein insertase
VDRLQIAAIAVAVLLFAASIYFRPPTPPKTADPAPAPAAEAQRSAPGPEQNAATPPVVEPRVNAEALATAPASAKSQILTLRNDAVEVRVSNRGGRVESIALLNYRATVTRDSGPVELVTTPQEGGMFLYLGPEPLHSLEDAPAQVTSSDAQHVELRTERDGVVVTRRVELDDSGHGGRLTVNIANDSSDTVRPKLQLAFYGQERPALAPDHFPKYSLAVSADGSVKRTPLLGVGTAGFVNSLLGRGPPTGTPYAEPVEWVGVDSQYFLFAAVAQNPREATAFAGPLGTDTGQAALSLAQFEVPPKNSIERTFRLYFGPKIEEDVVAVDPQLGRDIDAGWAFVRPLVTIFGSMLHWMVDHVVPNYGIAIILLTILVKVVTFPLTQRSMKSMKRFSQIAPQMKQIQEKYANDSAKLQEEMMKLYRQKGMNPLTAFGGGCVPTVIQMPVLIALYFALQTSIDLRHAPFAFWIKDLSAPENFFSIAGIPIRLLPLLMGGSMFLQQRLSPAPNADPQQRQMMTLMSVMFTFMFYQFPAGLVLYWLVSNVLGVAQQLLVNRSPQPATTPSEKAA